jgi:hypothetical protein
MFNVVSFHTTLYSHLVLIILYAGMETATGLLLILLPLSPALLLIPNSNIIKNNNIIIKKNMFNVIESFPSYSHSNSQHSQSQSSMTTSTSYHTATSSLPVNNDNDNEREGSAVYSSSKSCTK